ncbi:GGDEF domain-containing protein [Rudaea sp.]|uniref:GGDEF domain-containing protein n=1 Tax=Rudaea sp. TaxID=2136325 RepID=UPI00321FE5CE
MSSSRNQDFGTDRQTVLESTRRTDSSSRPRLIVVSGVLLGSQIELGDAPVVIGRSGDCTLVMAHPSVSRVHCRILREGNRYLVEDLGSTNRTYLNGKPVVYEELRDGDQIGIGSNSIKYFVGASMEADYHRELIDLAIYDSLTGFYNRRHFRSLLDDEVGKARASADTNPLCLLMVDLDHFKDVNDRLGHLAGDQVLGGVAQILRERVPADAAIGRLGGEEFALMLRDCPLAGAAELAEALCAAVAARAIETREGAIATTISIGVAAIDAAMQTASDLLRRADARLYRAKQTGRNRACAID